MFIVTRDTLRNPHVLETRSLPKRILGRVMLRPATGAGWGIRARLLLEIQILRYTAALLPFVLPMFIWRDLAMPIAQAPLAMVVVIAFVEMRILTLSKTKRATLMSEDDAAQRLDVMTFRARACLRAIAARHDLNEGALHLVIEQSPMARVVPLTLVSVQSELPKPQVLDLDDGDRAVLHETLFDTDFSERDLHLANLRLDMFLRDTKLETRSVSAHARLAAWIDKADLDATPEGA